MLTRGGLFRCIAVVGLTTVATAFPNPMTDNEACGVDGNQVWLCDPSEALSAENKRSLEEELLSIYNDTDAGCAPGFVVAVALTNGEPRNGRNDPDSDSEAEIRDLVRNFAIDLLNVSWIPYKSGDCANAVLLAVDIELEMAVTRTTKLTMKMLSDVQARSISTEVVQALRDDSLNDGVANAVRDIGKILRGYKPSTPWATRHNGSIWTDLDVGPGLITSGIGIVSLVAVLWFWTSRRCPRCGQQTRKSNYNVIRPARSCQEPGLARRDYWCEDASCCYRESTHEKITRDHSFRDNHCRHCGYEKPSGDGDGDGDGGGGGCGGGD